MRIAPAWPKALALCSTLVLASCYVWWSQERTSARREKEAARETQVLPGSKSFVFSGESAGDEYRARSVGGKLGKGGGEDARTNADFIAPDPETKKERTMLPSSKIGLVSPPQQESHEDTKKERTMLPGSKSAAFGDINRESIDRLLNAPEKENEKVDPEKQRTVLPGSKSLDRILPPPDLEKKSEP